MGLYLKILLKWSDINYLVAVIGFLLLEMVKEFKDRNKFIKSNIKSWLKLSRWLYKWNQLIIFKHKDYSKFRLHKLPNANYNFLI